MAVPALAILLAIIGFLVFQRRKGRKARVGGEEREKASGTEVERNVENPQLPEDVSTGGRI